MGIITVTDEYTSPIPHTRIFKSLILDADNLIPKLLPQIIKGIEIVEGDGGAGTIKQMNFAEGTQFKSIKHRIDEIDVAKCIYNYTLIEGDALGDKLEKISYEAKFEASPEGGTISTMTSKYYVLDDAAISEEEIKAGKEKAIGIYKAVEAYLLQNPHAYV
ncbi:hypothetical protein ACH5RR_033517 [Cinchona calisaya]|uniref:Bet v I/Major latex protein domain-containing protein n=1 Tax=Cinchona calisaya TaxID=153742 RepID=A0ABD2YQ88_9GENT